MAMALPVYAEADPLPDVPDEVELLEGEPETAPGEDTAPPEQNAATPEPEQSAEPEQPAPAETPEPTAEPTPTPEPAATATATPVPTVTPTATPEPTEQPQKMYAARSGDNVQAVSETGVPDTYTLYFAVPSSWSDFTSVKIYAVDTNNSNEQPYTLDMQEADKTKDGRKIYSALLNKTKHYRWGGLNGLEFHEYNENGFVDKVVIADVNARTWWKTFDPTRDDYIGGNYYDPEAVGEKWSTYTVTVRHDDFAGKEMAFENKTSKTLTNVQAGFYEPDKDDAGKLKPVGTPIPLNSIESGSDIAPNSTATVTIPNVLCSYVQFTWDEGGSKKYSKIYNFYGEDVSGDDEKSFKYSDTSNCFIYTGEGNERWGIEKSVLIYYDATFSKLPTTGMNDTGGNYSIPKANNPEANQSTVYYRLKGENKESIGGPMIRIEGTDYYAADVPEGYTQIVFSSYLLSSDEFTTTCGDTTNWVDIPSNVTEPCFYADTNDDAVYSKGTRGGYWAPKGTKRDAETWKNKNTDTKVEVVDIAPAVFTEESNTKYVTSTLYDYYTDYELNGNNRDSYQKDFNYGFVSHRNWVPFREFDQALSDYYEKAKAPYPIYTGHFQPGGGTDFSQIADTLKLFGYNNFNRFMAINNSQRNDDNSVDIKHTYYAYQGLVADKTSNGNADGAPLLYGTKSTVEPHFNKDFLLGENSKKAKLGEVYENVKFPFTKKENLFDNDPGVDYWCFDSKDTTLYLKQDSGQNSDSKYFLQSTNNRESSKNVNASSGFENVTNTYGYFPFNEKATSGVASTYNYGFGTKLQMDFTLTDDGMVETNKIGEDNKKVKTNIKFFFSGDDDVWVFIDGQLVLDVGGAHGKVSGLLEFGKADEKSNSVTAYVSRVKKGGTSDSDKDEKNGNSAVKTVKYNGEDIYFYEKSIPLVAENTPLVLDKGKKHTLTMYYMERGMWESNMAVAFNFPDNNELQVQKKVELKNVNPAFQDCFKNQKIFNFTIQNQATHYGEKEAAKPNPSDTKEVNLDADVSNIAPATPDKKNEYIFELFPNPRPDPGQEDKNEQVLHWYARYPDTEPVSYWRKQRYGILTLENPIDIEKMRFLTFQVYTDSNDGGELSLNNLYLELLDNQQQQDPTKSPGQKGSLGTTGINGATYGSVELETGKWVTVKLDLHKMKEQGGFNNKVKFIRVGDNYSRNIYFRKFTFIPKAVPSTMTGFTTDQEKIPDYGSAKTGQLQNAENAQYTSNMDNDTQLVDENGRFVLEDGEIVTFSDQFRRGSYISLKEELNENLYDTTWTVYENGQKVTSMEKGKSVILPSPTPSLIGRVGSGPDDGRTEAYDESVKNDGYTESKKPDNPNNPNTIVFRSYKNPDETKSTLTKLKVEYVNTVKTGGLKIQKEAAAGEVNNIKGIYTFKVTFSNVGGEGLEEKSIEIPVTIDMGKGETTGTITGIPVGTRYTIEEVKTNDGSRLQSVTVPPDCHSAQVFNNNTMVEGKIVESIDPNNPEVTAIFTNTKRKLINIAFDKLWIDADDKELKNQPEAIYIQLQRRLAGSTRDEDWKPVKYPADNTLDYVTITYGENGWKYTFSGLDQYQINADNSKPNYEYRIVEGTLENGQFKQAAKDGTITIKGNTYVVTAEATPSSETSSETNSEGSSTGNTTPATDGTITGGSGKIVLTNKLQNPKFVLDIIKQDPDDKTKALNGVEFKLEKLVKNAGETQWKVEASYKFDDTHTGSITATTKGDGKITGVFTNLEPGRYRLTETKAHPGYNLLAQPIVIEFTQDGKCYIDDVIVPENDESFKRGTNNTYTMTLTVLNRKTPELPHTGADAPSLWLLIGMPLAVAGLLIFTFRYNRKGGRRH